MTRRALITGITGQDGSYLADFLLDQGCEVHGMVRSASDVRFERLEHIRDRIRLHQADLLDQLSIMRLVEKVQPRDIYNLAAQTFVPTSWSQPLLTSEVTGLGVARMLETVRQLDPTIRFFQASSSEMFGNATEEPQNERTPFNPRSPYGVAKLYGHMITVNYRASYGIYAVSGIMFNHESPRRGLDFVTRKITDAVARIKFGLQEKLFLGNLDAQRDWGHADDYVRAMWLMMNREDPDDYVIATGEKHSVREFVEVAFARADLDWRKYVEVDPTLNRPVDLNSLCGDASKARHELGWQPTAGFVELVHRMADADLQNVQHEIAI